MLLGDKEIGTTSKTHKNAYFGVLEQYCKFIRISAYSCIFRPFSVEKMSELTRTLRFTGKGVFFADVRGKARKHSNLEKYCTLKIFTISSEAGIREKSLLKKFFR